MWALSARYTLKRIQPLATHRTHNSFTQVFHDECPSDRVVQAKQLKEGRLLVGMHMPGGRVFPRLSSISKISIDPGPEGVLIGSELRILLRAHSDCTSHGIPTQHPELGFPSSQGQAGRNTSDPYAV